MDVHYSPWAGQSHSCSRPRLLGTCQRPHLCGVQAISPFQTHNTYFEKDEIFYKLIVSLARLCVEYLMKKYEIANEMEYFSDPLTVYNSEYSSSGKDHDRILAIIKDTIDVVEKEQPKSETPPVAEPNDEITEGLAVARAPARAREASLAVVSGGAEKKRKREVESNEHVDKKRTKRRSRSF
ncbi:hypothetical protein CVT25_003886 [Psilocybe cyanescens]|uniref:Uncharacterized protein n=1 Tax=Psilocybe cyanescens TaxID=93625 RepID=A0A409XQ01_PSICY|nr:hypothetical protein CVT25_003886 [Psilocybe cyanescens]